SRTSTGHCPFQNWGSCQARRLRRMAERYAYSMPRGGVFPPEQPILSDGIVTLTRFTADDAPTMVQWDHDTEMARWFDWELVPPTPDDQRHAEQVVERWHREYELGERIPWAVRDPTLKRLLGSVELRPRADAGADASYATHPSLRGMGCATRALRLACD